MPAIVEALAEGRYDVVHVCSPGPAGVAAWLLARVLELPRVGSYHTELGAYAGLRTGQPQRRGAGQLGPRPRSTAPATWCSRPARPATSGWPSWASLPSGSRDGIAASTCAASIPRFAEAALLPGAVNVLYAGRLSKEKGVDLLADAFLEAHRRDPRLHLVLAGGGPEEGLLRERLGDRATFLGWLSGDALAQVYASADAFLFASTTETFGQVILEAQASGLPVVAVDRGGPASLIEHGETGLLAPPEVSALADAVVDSDRHSASSRAHWSRRADGGARSQLGGCARPARHRLSHRARRRGTISGSSATSHDDQNAP